MKIFGKKDKKGTFWSKSSPNIKISVFPPKNALFRTFLTPFVLFAHKCGSFTSPGYFMLKKISECTIPFFLGQFWWKFDIFPQKCPIFGTPPWKCRNIRTIKWTIEREKDNTVDRTLELGSVGALFFHSWSFGNLYLLRLSYNPTAIVHHEFWVDDAKPWVQWAIGYFLRKFQRDLIQHWNDTHHPTNVQNLFYKNYLFLISRNIGFSSGRVQDLRSEELLTSQKWKPIKPNIIQH